MEAYTGLQGGHAFSRHKLELGFKTLNPRLAGRGGHLGEPACRVQAALGLQEAAPSGGSKVCRTAKRPSPGAEQTATLEEQLSSSRVPSRVKASCVCQRCHALLNILKEGDI